LMHVAIIRSDDGMTYLAINGHIEDSAESVEYYSYDPVKLGSGHVGAFDNALINFRTSVGTDRGWTTDFEPPNFNPPVDQFTKFLMDSTSTVGLYDRSVNGFDVTVIGTAPVVTQDTFHYQLTHADHNNTVISSTLVQDDINFRLPNEDCIIHFLPTTGQTFNISAIDAIVAGNDAKFCKLGTDYRVSIQRLDDSIFFPVYEHHPTHEYYPTLHLNRIRETNYFIPNDTTKITTGVIDDDLYVFANNNGSNLKSDNKSDLFTLVDMDVADRPFVDSPRPFRIAATGTYLTPDAVSYYHYNQTIFCEAIIYLPADWNTNETLFGQEGNWSHIYVSSGRQLVYYINGQAETFGSSMDVATWYHIGVELYGTNHMLFQQRSFKTGALQEQSRSETFNSTYSYMYPMLYTSNMLYYMIRYTHQTLNTTAFQIQTDQAFGNHEAIYRKILL